MNTAVINVKVDSQVKREVQQVADELGLSVSALVHGFFKQLVRTREVTFSVREEPSEFLIRSIKSAEEDIKKGRAISFKSTADELNYLDRMIARERARKR